MQNISRFIFVIAFFVSQTSSAAASRPVTREELAKQLTYYQSISELNAKFTETKTLKDMALKLESDGELTVVRPVAGTTHSQVVWRVIHPSALTVTLSEGSVKIVSGDGKTENYAIEGSAKESLKALVAWLKLDPEELIQSYRISQEADGAYRFEPKGEASIAAMVMTLQPGSYLEQLRIEEKSGDSLLIRFQKPTLKKASHAK